MFKWLTQALPRLRARVGFVDTVLTVHERVGAVGGGAYSSALALAAFVSLFPLMLVLIAVLGFFTASNVDLPAETVERLGLDGRAAETVINAFSTAERTRATATIIGVIGLLWSGLALVDSVAAMINTVWQVTGRGIVGKLHELAWLAGTATMLMISIGSASVVQLVPGPAIIPTLLIGLALDTLLCMWTFRTLANVGIPWQAHLPGAILGGVGYLVLKVITGVYVPRLVSQSSTLYGSIGVVFALLAWFVLGAKLLMYATAYNVVRFERGHGTVTVSIQVPHIEGEVPRRITRGGAVAESAPSRPPDPADEATA